LARYAVPMRLYGVMIVPLLWLCQMPGAQAHTLTARIAQIKVPGARLHEISIHLHWPEDAPEGALSIQIGRVDIDLLAEPVTQLHWQCPLRREEGWRCDGEVYSATQPPRRLAVAWSNAVSEAHMEDGVIHIHLRREAARSDLTRIDLTQIPLVWLQSWLAQVWPSARLGGGRVNGEIQLLTPVAAPLQLEAAFTLDNGALETEDGQIAADGINVQAELALAIDDSEHRIQAHGTLHGGEVLVENAYLALPHTPITLEAQAHQHEHSGWQLSHLLWRDGDVLEAQGSLGLTANAALDAFDVHLWSQDLSVWPERYLSGWLGLAGLAGLQMNGALEMELHYSADGLERLDASFDAVNLDDAQGRFALTGLNGRLTHAARGQHGGELGWQSGSIGAAAFGPAHWPVQSLDGLMQLTAPVEVAALNGQILLHPLRLHLPHAEQGLQLDFGLHLRQLDLAPLSTALGWPAFRGQLTGSIPAARYADGWLDLAGGLSMAIFDGRIDVTALVMERPFGVAPTLTVDLNLMNLDLMNMTEVFDFGSISGRLDGQIKGLRLIDWRPTAFDAELYTVPGRGVRQRISQRAVQDISGVGGGMIMHSMQGRMITLFDDFGYRRIGLRCRLLNEVCRMSGLHSEGSGFTIVEGSGLPRLNVIGFNHEVDWPTLIERLTQMADGTTPVVQ